jgi:hypothetical protein
MSAGFEPVPLLLLLPLSLGVDGFALESVLLGFESLGLSFAAGESGFAVLPLGAGAAEPAAVACGAGMPECSSPQPEPARRRRVNEQDASVRAYVLVMTVPNACCKSSAIATVHASLTLKRSRAASAASTRTYVRPTAITWLD